MPLSIGIVGLPNVGKSTLFNCLGEKKAPAANYPFCTIEPNVSLVNVPDERLAKIAAISKPARIVPTAIEFVDIAGLVKGASQGEGLGNKFLANIRECDAIAEVVRGFIDGNIIHVHGQIDPGSDREVIGLELIYADLAVAEKRLDKAGREAKAGDKEAIKLRDLLARVHGHLSQGLPIRSLGLKPEDSFALKSLGLLTAKPIIYVLNLAQDEIRSSAGDVVRSRLFPNGDADGEVVALDVKVEEEIVGLPESDRAEYYRELGITESGLDRLIRSAYRLLGLVTFFTTGTDETRAWTVRAGSLAPVAAGVIHTDFEKGFIRAEVMTTENFLACGSEAEARNRGLLRTEGRDYVIQDGDIVNFLVNN